MHDMETIKQNEFDAWCKERGRPAQVAKALGLAAVNVHRWRENGWVPAEHCPTIEQMTGIRAEALNDRVQWLRVRGKPVAIASSAAPARMAPKKPQHHCSEG